MSTAHCFDRFEVQPVERRLLIDGQPVTIGARAFDLLQTLVENPGRLLTKNELLDRVWPGLVVEEANLHVQVCSLRKLLGPKVIATIPGRGYRFAVALNDALGAATRGPQGIAPAATTDPAEAITDRRHNLPEASASLIGRDADVEDLNRLLDRHRLVTVLGSSGIGKTRLALAVARQRVALHAQGVWWVDLGALRTADQIAPAIAQAAGTPLGDGDAAALLRRALALRDTLIVLDNCEHLIADVSRIAAAALAGAPKLRLLATSLESLKVAGEQVFRLDPLAVPPGPMPLELARCFGAIQLLEQRAQAVDQHFFLSDGTVSQAIDLCRQLDGVALAIEIAAARLPVLGFDALASHLGDRQRGLRNAGRAVPARHQSLGAAHDWAHSLLADEEKYVLRRLAVFTGSFTLDAALAVANAGGMDESVVLDALFGLVDKSMLKIIQLEPPRYRLLESTRLYATQRLEASGEADAALRRHTEAMTRLAVELDGLYWVTPDRELLRRFMADYDDLQLCYERACAASWVTQAVELSAALTMLRNLRVIGAGRHERLKSAARLLPQAQGATRAKLLGLFANTYVSTIQEVSRANAARELVALRRALGDHERLYEALGAQAAVSVVVGDLPTATRAVAEGRQLERPDWPARRRAQFAFQCGNVCKELGDIAGCARAMQDVLEISVRAGFDQGVWMAQLGLADAALLADDVPSAIATCRQAMATLHDLNIECAWAQAAAELGAAQLMARQVEDAKQSLRKAQPILEVGEGDGLILSHVAALCALSGRPSDAARLLGCSDAWYAANQSRPNVTVAKLDKLASTELDALLGGAEFTRLRALGAAMTGDEPYRLARSVIGVSAPQ